MQVRKADALLCQEATAILQAASVRNERHGLIVFYLAKGHQQVCETLN